MVVPYGDPGPLHGWKNAFDVGEWGLGRMVNSLKLGCDCLGVISYLDATLSSEQGDPYVVEQRHLHPRGGLRHPVEAPGHAGRGRTEVRRSRRLVVSSISTVGNYEYGFYWYFYLDGTIQLEVKLTGILSTQAMAPGEASRFAPADRARDWPRPSTSTCSAPGSTSRSTARSTRSTRSRRSRCRPGTTIPWSNGFVPVVTRLESEQEAQRDVDSASGRYWKFVNPDVRNRLGEPVAYKLLPWATPTMLAHPDSSVGRRAGFARHNLWVTPFAPRRATRRRATTRTSMPAGTGCPRWTAARPSAHRHRHRGLAHLRGHPHPPSRGLAGDAGRVLPGST